MLKQKYYELKDHLGNVRATISDLRTMQNSLASATVESYNTYYPFGMLMPGTNRQGASGDYRYGFQGQEQENDIKGVGNIVDYKYRIHDVRIGRFFSVDPLTAKYPFYSPYSFSGNRVIDAIEFEGLEPVLGDPNYGKNIIVTFPIAVANIHPKVRDLTNENWIAFNAKTLPEAYNGVKLIKESDNSIKIQNFYLQSHGTGATMTIVSNKVDFDMTWDIGLSLSVLDIEHYINAQKIGIEAYLKKNSYLKKWYADTYPLVDALKKIIDNIEDNGNFITGACWGAGSTGMLLKALYELGGKRINIYGNLGINAVNEMMLDRTFVKEDGKGYYYVGPKTKGEVLEIKDENHTGSIILSKTGEALQYEEEN